LRCTSLHLTSLPSLPLIRELICVDNLLTQLPPLPNINILYCGENRLTTLPPLPQVTELYCDHNQLTLLPQLPNVNILKCNNNQITVLPSLDTVTRLYCDHNQLTELPTLPKVITLHCSNNLLKLLPTLNNITTVRTAYHTPLECSNNPNLYYNQKIAHTYHLQYPSPGHQRYWIHMWKKSYNMIKWWTSIYWVVKAIPGNTDYLIAKKHFEEMGCGGNHVWGNSRSPMPPSSFGGT
jgi:hypothetical protein